MSNNLERTGTFRPDLWRMTQDIQLDIRKLWKKVNLLGNAGQGTGRPDPMVFSYSGSLFASESEAWLSLYNVTCYQFDAILKTAGTTGTTVLIRLNGSSTATTLTWGAGETRKTFATSFNVAAAADFVTAQITVVGTGAKDLSIFGRTRLNNTSTSA